MKPLNPNKQKKKSFKEKAKTFFNIPSGELIEENTWEGLYKLSPVKLTQNKIFFVIALSLILFNILSSLDINFLYLKQIFNFLFIILVPGILLMLCFKIRKLKAWEFFVYTIGLSLFFIMIAGLVINWGLPAIGLTQHPLSLPPVIICFNIFLIIIGVVAWKRNRDFKSLTIAIPNLSALNSFFFIFPMLFPVLSILGAFILNNHGPNILIMIMIVLIALYVLTLRKFRGEVKSSVYPWALWMIAMALLLMVSLTSWNLSLEGDMGPEYKMFLSTDSNNLWNPLAYRHAYNSCLSITILPEIFLQLGSYSHYSIFNLLFPLLFSLISPIVFLIFKKSFSTHVSFLSAFFFITQIPFMFWLPRLARQEIAFIFFGLIMLSFFSKDIDSKNKKVLFIIFGISLIVSHYSTAYVSLAIFFLVNVLDILCKKLKERKNAEKIAVNYNRTYLIGSLLLLLFSFAFLWYNQVTFTGEGIIHLGSNSIKNMADLFNSDLQSSSTKAALSIGSLYKNLITTPEDIAEFEVYLREKYNLPQSELYPVSSYANSKLSPMDKIYLPWTNKTEFMISSIFFSLIVNLTKLLLVLGFFYLFFMLLSKKHLEGYFLISLVCCFLLSLITIPFFSTSYNLERLYQHIFIILSPVLVLGSFFVLKKLGISSDRKVFKLITIFLVIYFLFNSGFAYQAFGGEPASNLNRFGTSYNEKYFSSNGVSSIEWIGENYKGDASINLDSSSFQKFVALTGLWGVIEDNLYPSLIPLNSYVYLGEFNLIENKMHLSDGKKDLLLSLPSDFLEQNKNKIYNNGGSEIFR
jgi:uncharacterized membrane protein